MPPHSFDSSLAWLRQREPTLPFEVGAATQHGRLKTMNNQDAIAIVLDGATIIAVVSDGCASSENSEVGARLMSLVVAEEIAAQIARSGSARLPEDLPSVEERILERLRSLAAAVGPADATTAFIQSYLYATIVGVAIDRDHAVIFGCGDGLYASDAVMTCLPEDELYLAMRLLDGSIKQGKLPRLRVYSERRTTRTRSVMIATDGMQDLWDRYPQELRQYLRRSEVDRAVGFSHELLWEFNRTIWFDPVVNAWASTQDAHDDRSFVVIRRIKRSRKRKGDHAADH